MATSLVQIYAASSVDGYLAPPDGTVDWLESFDAQDLGFDDFYSHVGAIISGRVTFDQAVGFNDWMFAGKPMVVLTSHDTTQLLDQLPDEIAADVTFDRGHDLPALTQRLRDTTGDKNVWLLGGGKLHQTFLEAGLVDEIWTHVLPVLLGDGIRLLPPPYAQRTVSLVETRAYANGAVMLRYSLRPSD